VGRFPTLVDVSRLGGMLVATSVLTTLREAKGLNQVELAKRAGVTTAYLNQLEHGKRKNPSLDILKKLAKALGVPVTELLE
jgi:transcriptional regulator with XRE-family HTH domain